MTDQHALGNKLMLAFDGETPPPRIVTWLKQRPVAGFSLFRPLNVRTPAQVRALSAELQQLAHDAGQLPLLIATDQEGGQLNALGEATTQFAGNMALAATRDAALAQRVAEAMGRELAAMGVNVNYAPNCDINTHADNPAAGARTFGDDAALAADMAAAVTRGYQAAGVAATIKHFPGKGAATVDSHYELPLIAHSRDRLHAVELKPFKAAMAAGAKLVMTGHFAIPSLTDSAELPATLSRAVMHDLVRGELGFNGVIISDALDMGALTQGAGQLIDALAAVRAGVDLLLTTNQPEVQERLYSGLQLAHSRQLLDEQHLQRSLRRIAALRTWVARHPQPDLGVVGCAAHQALAAELARRAITLLRDDAHLLPLRLSAETTVAVIMPQPQNLTPADTSQFVTPTLAQAIHAHHPHVTSFIHPHTPDPSDIAALRDQLAAYDLLVVGTIAASTNPAQAALANALLTLGKPTITVALRTPYDLRAYPQAQTHLCTYAILPPSMTALAAALFGRAPISGQLPVTIDGVAPFGAGLTRA
jgi:beta-N-acetylhexosaminidase